MFDKPTRNHMILVLDVILGTINPSKSHDFNGQHPSLSHTRLSPFPEPNVEGRTARIREQNSTSVLSPLQACSPPTTTLFVSINVPRDLVSHFHTTSTITEGTPERLLTVLKVSTNCNVWILYHFMNADQLRLYA